MLKWIILHVNLFCDTESMLSNEKLVTELVIFRILLSLVYGSFRWLSLFIGYEKVSKYIELKISEEILFQKRMS